MSRLEMEAPPVHTAKLRGYRQSPQKARLIADLVRGKTVGEALNILKFTHNRAARPIEQTIRSAAANALHAANRVNETLDELSLVVCEIRVDQGMKVSRWRPRSRGMANPYQRYYCHFSVSVIEPENAGDLREYRQIVSQKKTRQAGEIALRAVRAAGRAAAQMVETEEAAGEDQA